MATVSCWRSADDGAGSLGEYSGASLSSVTARKGGRSLVKKARGSAGWGLRPQTPISWYLYISRAEFEGFSSGGSWCADAVSIAGGWHDRLTARSMSDVARLRATRCVQNPAAL